MNLTVYIEALLFTSSDVVQIDSIHQALEKHFDVSFNMEEIENCLRQIQDKYSSEEFAFELVEINNGFLFLTKPKYHALLERYIMANNPKKLSKSALETLSIIAYKQPIIKSDIEHIRGVNCDYAIQKLLDKELVEISGRSDKPGRPLIYKTSDKFMNHFGLKSIKDLPNLKDFETSEESIGIEKSQMN